MCIPFRGYSPLCVSLSSKQAQLVSLVDLRVRIVPLDRVDGRAQRLVSLTEGRETTQSSKSPFLFYKNKRSSLVDL